MGCLGAACDQLGRGHIPTCAGLSLLPTQLPTSSACRRGHLKQCVLLPAAWMVSLLVLFRESLPVLQGTAGKTPEY